MDSNHGPFVYKTNALPTELNSRVKRYFITNVVEYKNKKVVLLLEVAKPLGSN